MATGTGVNVSKANLYGVVEPEKGVNASKAQAYAVLEPLKGVNVTKAVIYAVVVGNPFYGEIQQFVAAT